MTVNYQYSHRLVIFSDNKTSKSKKDFSLILSKENGLLWSHKTLGEARNKKRNFMRQNARKANQWSIKKRVESGHH